MAEFKPSSCDSFRDHEKEATLNEYPGTVSVTEHTGTVPVTEHTGTVPVTEHTGTVPVTQVLNAQVLQHYEGIKSIESRLKELLDSQEECINGLSEENIKYNEIMKNFNFNAMFDQMAFYTKKLNHLSNNMTNIDDRVARLKHRSKMIKEHQDRKCRERREAKAKEEELERLLTAKPIWEVDKQPIQRND